MLNASIWAVDYTKSDQIMVQEIVQRVNAYRIANGLKKLNLSNALSSAAQQHSLDMAKNRAKFGHDGFANRIKYLHNVLPKTTNGAENVAFNYKSAKIVVDGWFNSSGHKRNMLGHYDLTGIGLARNSRGQIYFTQMFLKLA